MKPTAQDRADFSTAARKVEAFMLGVSWAPASKIIDASGQREGLRRLRELRARYDVLIRRNGSKREFEYMLKPRLGEPIQTVLDF